MATSRFDRMTTAFANRRLSRRGPARGGAEIAAGAPAAGDIARSSTVQEATPDAGSAPGLDAAKDMLFVQTYRSGTIVPTEGQEGRYTLTLETGTGQTVYFSDRPDRIVGASPTPQFLAGLGFLPDNPPNAALVVETAPGETDVAVVELFNPVYDPISQGVTYEVEVLANWQNDLALGLHEAPTDLAALAPSFGTAQLFIDDCPGMTITCVPKECKVYRDCSRNGCPIVYDHCDTFGVIPDSAHDGFCYSWYAAACVPCEPRQYRDYEHVYNFLANQCNTQFPACNGNCKPSHWCSNGLFNCST